MARKLNLIGASFGLGQEKAGVDLAPSILRKNGAIKIISNNGFQIKDLGDYKIPFNNFFNKVNKKDFPNLINAVIGYYNMQLSRKIRRHNEPKSITLCLGGDQSASMGTIAAHLKTNPNLGVVWVDANADISTNEKTPPNRKPLAYLTKMAKMHRKSALWLSKVPTLQNKNIVYIGLRNVEETEKRIIKENGIFAMYCEENDGELIERKIQRVLDKLKHCESIHLSFDIDALDSKIAPSMGEIFEGGLSIEDGMKICDAMYRSKKLNSVDLVEVNPLIGSEKDRQTTIKNALKIIYAMTGGLSK